MTALQSVVLTLPARLDDRAMAAFEGVFSELLDSAATSFQRDDAGAFGNVVGHDVLLNPKGIFHRAGHFFVANDINF